MICSDFPWNAHTRLDTHNTISLLCMWCIYCDVFQMYKLQSFIIADWCVNTGGKLYLEESWGHRTLDSGLVPKSLCLRSGCGWRLKAACFGLWRTHCQCLGYRTVNKSVAYAEVFQNKGLPVWICVNPSAAMKCNQVCLLLYCSHVYRALWIFPISPS